MKRPPTIELDTSPGELYHLPGIAPGRPQVLKGRKIDGSYVLIDEKSGKRHTFSAGGFASMRGDGGAIRISRTSIRGGQIVSRDPNPRAFLPEDQAGISAEEREARAIASTRLLEGRTLYFYVIKHDRFPGSPKGRVGLTKFIHRHYPEALAAGYVWKPSDSAVRRALAKGSPGNRSYADIVFSRGEHDPGVRWPEAVVRLKARVIDHYYSSEPITYGDAQAWFFTRLSRLNQMREAIGLKPYDAPNEKTVIEWIKLANNAERCATKYGPHRAYRQFGGRKRLQAANQAFEVVMIDHTQLDLWVVILDNDGCVIATIRPWLAIAYDLMSGTILAAVMTEDPPSIASLMACIRQSVRPRDFLRQGLRDHKGAQGWGRTRGILVLDNGLENVGISLQVACESAGMEVVWAPVRCPEFKSPCERFFNTLNNGVWHKLRGAVPRKPHRMAELGLNGQREAYHTLEEANELLWEYVVTIYHVEPRDRKKAPAKAMMDCLLKNGRPTVDDVSALDKVLGKAVRRTLSAEGISVGGLRFHDPEITSDLLDGLMRFGQPSGRHQELSSGKVKVLVTLAPSDCSYVHVWHPLRNCHVRLPAWNHTAVEGLSWKGNIRLRRFAKLEGLAFHSSEEVWAAREEFNKKCAAERSPVYATRSKASRPAKLVPRLIDGHGVEEAVATPSVNGSRPVEVPYVLALPERGDDLVPPIGPRRGPSKRHSLSANRGQHKAAPKKPTKPQSDTMPTKEDPPILILTEDADEMLASLAADLD